MKNLFFLFVFGLLSSSSVHALSCASFPSFEDLMVDAEVMIQGTVEEVSYVASEYNEEFCAQQGGNAVPGTYTYTISLDEVVRGEVGDVAILTRTVSDINCTR